MRVMVLALAACLAALPVRGAEITLGTPPARGMTVIAVSGPLDVVDVETFREVANGAGTAVVILDSPGGEGWAGMQISREVRDRGFSTLVPDGAECASACVLVWLAGVTRYVEGTGRVGFHAAPKDVDGALVHSAAGSALAGAYLEEIGFSFELIEAFTGQRGEDDAPILNREEADRLGLQVVWLGPRAGMVPDKAEETEAAPAKPAPPASAAEAPERRPAATARHAPEETTPAGKAATPARQRHAEKEAVVFVKGYFRWLASGRPMPHGMVSQFYAREVDFFGRTVKRQELHAELYGDPRRWPVPRIVMSGSPRAACDRRGRACRVTGRAQFFSLRDGAGRPVNGRLAYRIGLREAGGRFRIVSQAADVTGEEARGVAAADVRLTRRIQAELVRLGCLRGRVDGIWGPVTTAALIRFHAANGSAVLIEGPSERDYQMMTGVRGVLCTS